MQKMTLKFYLCICTLLLTYTVKCDILYIGYFAFIRFGVGVVCE